jgi:hypothetical protein
MAEKLKSFDKDQWVKVLEKGLAHAAQTLDGMLNAGLDT